MKKMFLVAFAAVFAIGVNAQNKKGESIEQKDAPQEVIETFNDAFASAKDVQWEKEGNTYEAEFKENGQEKEARISKTGDLEMVKTEITQEELPKEVQNTLTKDYADYQLEEFEKVEKEGKTHYKVEAEKDGKTEKLIFDSSGKKIRKEKMHKMDNNKMDNKM